MKKIQLVYFIDYSYLDQLDTSPYLNILKKLSKKFGKIYIINLRYLSFHKNSKNYNFDKHKNFFILKNPKNFSSLENILKNKKIIVLNSIGRRFRHLPLLIYLKLKKVSLLQINNLGNVQLGTHYYLRGKNFLSFNEVVLRNLVKKFFIILSILKLISKVDCKFTSNKSEFLKFKKRNFFGTFLSYYKDLKFVKSNIYEVKDQHKNTENFIVLIDAYPLYEQYTNYKKVDNEDIKRHYLYLNNLLNYLKKLYRKKIIVCIHPRYPVKFHEKYLPGKKIVKHQTKNYIKKSFMVLCYNSSSIVQAIKMNKRIVSVQSFLFKGEKYSSSIYQERLNSEKITIKKKYKFDKKIFLKRLDRKINNYKNYKRLYFGIDLKNQSSDDISQYICKKYLEIRASK